MYCIHCGVELRKGTTRCPLCGTDYEKVMSSLEEETAYPQNTNHNAKKIRNAQMRYIGILLSVASVIPIVICLLIDYLDHASITWSKYVILSVAVFWVFFILPFFVTGKKMLILSTADAIASILYFFLISRFTESQSWAVVVCGSIALVWCIVFLPFMMPKSLVSICACILIDGIATMLFLATLGLETSGCCQLHCLLQWDFASYFLRRYCCSAERLKFRQYWLRYYFLQPHCAS